MSKLLLLAMFVSSVCTETIQKDGAHQFVWKDTHRVCGIYWKWDADWSVRLADKRGSLQEPMQVSSEKVARTAVLAACPLK